jgi:hypothetical protein
MSKKSETLSVISKVSCGTELSLVLKAREIGVTRHSAKRRLESFYAVE